MYRIAICEDDLLAAEQNEKLVMEIFCDRGQRRGQDYEIDVFTQPDDLLFRLKKKLDAYHLLLLDIRLEDGAELKAEHWSEVSAARQMESSGSDWPVLNAKCGLETNVPGRPESNGVELAAFLRRKRIPCAIVYITGYRDYVFDSFATRPLEYLLKPVDKEKLANAISYDYQENYKPASIFLDASGHRAIRMKDILYVEATRHKVAVCLKDEVIFLNETLSGLAPRVMTGGFCRCHHSFIVNLGFPSSKKRTPFRSRVLK